MMSVLGVKLRDKSRTTARMNTVKIPNTDYKTKKLKFNYAGYIIRSEVDIQHKIVTE